jgi:hypothetical protein
LFREQGNAVHVEERAVGIEQHRLGMVHGATVLRTLGRINAAEGSESVTKA